jgi:hypothetical protein
VSFPILTQFLEDRQADGPVAGREGNLSEWVPEVLAEASRYGFLAIEGELG